MARKPRIPKYSLHKPSGRARVIVNGRHIWLGKHNSTESIERYNRIIAEIAAAPTGVSHEAEVPVGEPRAVVEVLALYLEHAKTYYVKDGKPTDQLAIVKGALRPVQQLYGRSLVTEFGPLKLKAVRQSMVDSGLCRKEVNRRVRIIQQAFKWAASEEFVEASIHVNLDTVDSLKEGRTDAPDYDPVEAVADEVVDATLPHLPPVIADMVRTQRLTGARPGEICNLRPCDLDRSDSMVWVYRPSSHKSQHRKKARAIYFGPRAQEVITPYLLRSAESYCFSPAESEWKRLKEAHAKRKTSLRCGNKPGTNRQRKPKRKPRDQYDTRAYRRAISRAVQKENKERLKAAKEAGIPESEVELLEDWAPNRLRHATGSEVRKLFGLESAQVILGHAKADTTEIYAERNAELARSVARKIG